MPDSIQTLHDLISQLTGEGGFHLQNILRNVLEATCWTGLLLVSRLKYKKGQDTHSTLLQIGFSAALTGALIMIWVQLLTIFGVVNPKSLFVFYPPMVHALSDFGDIFIAGGYISLLTVKGKTSSRFLKYGLISVVIVYIATALWWLPAVVGNPNIVFSETWCDWAFRLNACFWIGLAIAYLWMNQVGWSRYWVCTALALIFLDDFGKIIDMSHGNIYKITINPLRNLAHLTAILILGYIFIRQQAVDIRTSFDSLEGVIEQRTASLRATTLQLKTSLDRQIQFTADASHELRTPLTMIMNEIQWALSQRQWPEEYQESLETAQFASRHMKELLERLMELARLDVNANIDKRKKGDLRTALEESIPVLRRSTDRAKITLHFDPGEEEISLIADFDQLRQILLNLGENAVRHSPEGSQLHITLRKIGETAELKVIDEGEGISETDLPHIFERFYRGDKTRSELADGSGLGLAICQEIARSHGGKILAESRLEEGSSFTLTLPI